MKKMVQVQIEKSLKIGKRNKIKQMARTGRRKYMLFGKSQSLRKAYSFILKNSINK